MIAGKEAGRFGEAKNSWLTGTASWNFVALSQYLCGIRPAYDGLIVEPRLPSHIKNAEICRKFRGVTYHITVRNIKNNGKVTLSVKQGGKAEGTLVKADPETKDIYVTAEIK